LLQEHLPFFLAVVKSALRSISNYGVNGKFFLTD
jgi:hypothetical protein